MSRIPLEDRRKKVKYYKLPLGFGYVDYETYLQIKEEQELLIEKAAKTLADEIDRIIVNEYIRSIE